MKISLDEPLQAFNTLSLVARGQALAEVHDDEELREALLWARDNKSTVTVLGEGSNVVLAGDLSTLVLVQGNRGIDVLSDDRDEVVLRVAAGEDWHDLVDWSLEQGFYGLENLALIPGTVGAAPIQNIGAYGVELEFFVEAVHALRIDSSEPLTLSGGECQFAYRDSVFKHDLRDQLVITSVDLRLSKIAKLWLAYPTLASVFADRPAEDLTPRDVFEAVVGIRQSRLPDPRVEPNAGSFFKNPVLESAQADALVSSFPNLPAYPQSEGRMKFPAAWLIDHCGWKGHREEGVGVHPDHALVLVNYGGNSGERLLELAHKIAASVEVTFGIELEIEPRVYGGNREHI